MEPESKVLGATLDALDSVASDQGPNLMNLMYLKWPPGLETQTPTPDSGASEIYQSIGSDESHALKL